MKQSHRISAALLGLALFGFAAAASAEEGAASDAAVFRAKMERWVEARQILSAERADWLVEKETLRATQQLLRRERDDLRAAIAEFESKGVGADTERRELVGQRDDYQRGFDALAAEIRNLEEQVLAIVPRLPDPLRDRLEPLVVQIPTDPERQKVALGQRLMNVLGVLAQSEKWNATANFVGETRKIGDSTDKLQVRTLYWGLGQAIYVDSRGEIAGVGRPDDDGWSFSDDRTLAADAKLLLDIYEGNVDTIAFIPVPAEVR